MELNNKYLKVEFSSGKNKGTAHYFFDHQGVFFKTITWKNEQGVDEQLNLKIGFNDKWLERYQSAISGAYVQTDFETSPLKIKINHEGFLITNLVFNTILNSSANDRCLRGKYKFNENIPNNKKIILKNFEQIKIVDLMEFEQFRKLFYLYNHKNITSNVKYNKWLTDKYSDLVKFKEESIEEIKTSCGKDQS